jgi:outer membrane receptor protein involved in Fe transport
VNPDTSPGAPHFLVDYGIGISNYTPGGLIVSGPLMGTYFGEGGSIGQLEYGAVSGQWMQGGDWQYTTSGELGTNSLTADDERDSIFTRASYTLDNDVEVYVQGSYAEYEGLSHYINPTDRNITIFADNAFLPDEIVTQMTGLGLESFNMSTSNADMPASGSNNKRDTTRLVIGADGAFGEGWGWDAYYQHGITETDEHQLPTFSFDRLSMATDAVLDPDTMEIVCRSTLTDPANGCVPLNRFGVGVGSAAGLDYVLGRPRRLQEFQQDVAAVNFTTPDIDGWAGPISLAFGAEWRKEQMTGSVEEQYISGWKYGNYKVTEGEYDVSEIYVETVVPLTEALEFNGAARYTDYSTSGGVNTWKAGLTFSPIDSLTFRLTQSHDIRAPNLSELYAAGTARTNAVSIDGASTPFIQNLQGNPVVAPEEADTLGVGVVMRPSFAPGFAASIDYYDIEIDGVIDFIGAQDVADACFIFGVQRYCDNINFVDGVLSTIDLYYENLNILKAKGVDLEATYAFDLGPGNLTLRGLATHYIDNITDDGVTVVDDAGSNLQNTPDWVYRLSGMYVLDAWTFNLTARGVSDGVINNDYIECVSACPESIAPNYTINDNSVDGEWYLDAYVSNTLSFGGIDTEFYLAVRNLLDTDPVLIGNPANQGSENRPGYLSTNRDLYDVLGRTLRLGVRFDF